MSRFNTVIVIGSLALSSAALAQPARLSDAQYIALSRCQALMASPALGREDTRDIDARLKAQGAARAQAVFDRADEAKDQASQAARHGGAYGKAALVAERDGVCRALGGAGAMAAATGPAGAPRAN
jgi:hypothetical protein